MKGMIVKKGMVVKKGMIVKKGMVVKKGMTYLQSPLRVSYTALQGSMAVHLPGHNNHLPA
eukprot:1159493-Pelagomonas_calceolata.AAC.1